MKHTVEAQTHQFIRGNVRRLLHKRGTSVSIINLFGTSLTPYGAEKRFMSQDPQLRGLETW